MEEHAPIIVISGAMGSGKGTVIHALACELDLTWVPTHTTRTMRHDDAVISHRVFDTEVNFLRALDRGEMLIPAKVAGHYYGLLKSDLDKELRHHRPVIIEVTVDGGVELAKDYPHTLLVFLYGNKETVLQRIAHRHMAKEEQSARLKDMDTEQALAKKHYDFLIENVDGRPDIAIQAVKDIILDKFPELKQHADKAIH